MLTDDRRLAYSGEDYEKVLVRVFPLSSLRATADAAAYSLQVGAKQQQIIDAGGKGDDNLRKNYKQVPRRLRPRRAA
jgi:hypothetical protein